MTSPAPDRLPASPGLDGIRAIAVIAVVLYHNGDAQGLPAALSPDGGFLGVEVFFVLSGFLITSLLLAEHSRTTTISLRAFWVRRARRLLPALYLFLAGVSVLAVAFADDALGRLRAEVIGALFYVSNWVLMAGDESYFEASGRPSLLRHLWSLAIEEQFYVLWPVLLVVALRYLSRRWVVVLTLVAVASSVTLAWALFDRVERYGDVTSIYYRTDARASALLIGAVAAMVWSPWTRVGGSQVARARRRHLLDVVGLGALAAVIWSQYWFTDNVVEWGRHEVLYHGGFLLTSVPTVLVTAAVVVPGSRLGAVLGVAPLRWIGTRSYGIYLWHWPVFQLTRPRVDVAVDGWTVTVLRVVLTVVLAEVSHRVVEAPMRAWGVRESLRRAASAGRRLTRPTVAVAASVLVVVAGLSLRPVNHGEDRLDGSAVGADAPGSAAPGTATSEPDVTGPGVTGPDVTGPAVSSTTAASTTTTPPSTATTVATTAAPITVAAAVPAPAGSVLRDRLPRGPLDGAVRSVRPRPATGAVTPPSTVAQTPPPTAPASTVPVPITRVTVFGDSVVLGAYRELVALGDHVVVDARDGRQWWEAPPEISAHAAREPLGEVVVVLLGTNGDLSADIFDQVMTAIGPEPVVVFMTVRVPRRWEDDVNRDVTEGVARWPAQARLYDWRSVVDANAGYFKSDGVHLAPEGRQLLAATVAGIVAEVAAGG